MSAKKSPSKKSVKSTKPRVHRRKPLGGEKDFASYVNDLLPEKMRSDARFKQALSSIIDAWIENAAQDFILILKAKKNQTVTYKSVELYIQKHYKNHEFITKAVVHKEKGHTVSAKHGLILPTSRVALHFKNICDCRLGPDAKIALTSLFQNMATDLIKYVNTYGHSKQETLSGASTVGDLAGKTMTYEDMLNAIKHSPMWARLCNMRLSVYSDAHVRHTVRTAHHGPEKKHHSKKTHSKKSHSKKSHSKKAEKLMVAGVEAVKAIAEVGKSPVEKKAIDAVIVAEVKAAKSPSKKNVSAVRRLSSKARAVVLKEIKHYQISPSKKSHSKKSGSKKSHSKKRKSPTKGSAKRKSPAKKRKTASKK